MIVNDRSAFVTSGTRPLPEREVVNPVESRDRNASGLRSFLNVQLAIDND
jgi:hypothetical protein